MEPRRLHRTLKTIVAIIACALASATARGGVNLKNGNFYITYTDFSEDGFELERTYNSRANESSVFGYGWGFDLDTYISPLPDGRVMAHENGSGSLQSATIFRGKQALDSATDLAWLHLRNRSPRALASVRENVQAFAGDDELRASYLLSALARGRLATHPLDDGASFVSMFECGNPTCQNLHGWRLAKDGDVTVRRFWDGALEHFDKEGKMIARKSTSEGGGQAVSWRHNGGIGSVTTDKGAVSAFDYDDRGRLSAILGSRGNEATYRLDDSGNLVYSRDVAGNEYWHEYDKNHNMTRIIYSDKTSIDISYNDRQFCSRVKNRDNSVVEYEYVSDPANPDLHYWTLVRKRDPAGVALPENRYEYLIAVAPDGDRYTKRIHTIIDGDETSTEYLEDSRVETVTTNGKRLEYEYSAGLTSRVKGPVTDYRLSYVPKTKRIGEVQISRANGKDRSVWSFSYDEKGKPTQIRSDSGVSIDIGGEKDQPTITVGETVIRFKGSKISVDGRDWLQVSFRRAGEDGKYVAEIKSDPKSGESKAASLAQLKSLLDAIRVPLAMISDTLPPQMKLGWKDFDP